MDPFFPQKVNSGVPYWKMSLTFSLLAHLAMALLIFFAPQARKESGTPFVTRLVSPDELRREFPPGPPAKSSSRERLSARELPPARPALPPASRPQRETPATPAPSPQPGPGAAEKGIVPDGSAGVKGDRELSARDSQGDASGSPEASTPKGGGAPGIQRGPATPAPGPTLKEKLFDREIVERFAKREEKGHDSSITFDTKEFKYATYMVRLKERIEGIWRYPSEAAMRGIYGDLYIKFTIKKNGRLEDVELMRTSGHRSLDEAAMRALKDGEPYWPLPEEWGKDSLSITGHFVYSIYGTYIR